MVIRTRSRYRFVVLPLGLLPAVAALHWIGSSREPSVSAATLTAAQYTITDLGTLGGESSDAYGVNNRGEVVGGSDTADGARRAFVWENGRMHDLGTLGGKNSVAYRINDKGQAVGEADTPAGVGHAFLWSGDKMRDLGTFGGASSIADDINNAGEVVGTADLPARHRSGGRSYEDACAFLYRNGRLRRLKALSGEPNEAHGINNRSQIVGSSETETHDSLMRDHPFVYRNGKVLDLGAYELGSMALDINVRGQVIGKITGIESWNATVWQNGQVIDLGIFRTALGINDKGEIVGSEGSDPAVPVPPDHAVLWRNGKMVRLDDLTGSETGWVLKAATDINELGQIVGTGTKAGSWHAFMLSPRPPAP